MRVESHSSPLSGAQPFGNYYLVERIGVGGMAEVFLAVAVGPEGFQRPVVIKRILPHLLEDRAFVNMFIDEAKLCGVMSHPNIVQIFEFGKVADSFFIAMEHVRGRTLSAVQSRLNRIGSDAPIATSLEVIRQVCLGLDYAHSLRSAAGQSLGIVHRDVSPSNLMLGFHGGVKILDFGIARVAEGLRETRTQVGTMKGKVSYMSPEQARLEPVDNRSDIFSVGIVLHELLTGHRLFKTTDDHSRAHRPLQDMAVSPPSSVNPEVTPAIDRVVMRALEHDAGARYQTAGEMASEIGGLLLDMRAPPDGTERLLEALFPDGQSRRGEVDLALPFVPRALGDSGSGPSRISSARTSVGGTPQPSVRIGSGAGAWTSRESSARRAATQRRWWILAAAVSLAAIAGAVTAFRLPAPHHTARAVATVPAPAPAAVAPIAPLPIAAPAPVPAPVQVSLDSTPQDAEVAYAGSGQVVGRTPITVAVPRGHVAVTFRIQKSGHEPIDYKVIPDLDKAVRVDLVATRAREAQRAPAQHRGPLVRASAPSKPRHLRAAAPAPDPTRSAAQPRNCTLSVASFPWSELWIDGRDSGQRTPVVHYAVACGRHTLALRRPDLKLERSVAVILAPEHELKEHYELDSNYSE